MAENLLPVLHANHPAHSMCSFCPKQGHCCHGFILCEDDGEKSYWKDTGVEDATADLRSEGLPFTPLEISEEFVDEKTGRVYVTYYYQCPNLLPNGWCGDYENRPQLCRDFVPDSDELCIFKQLRTGIQSKFHQEESEEKPLPPRTQ